MGHLAAHATSNRVVELGVGAFGNRLDGVLHRVRHASCHHDDLVDGTRCAVVAASDNLGQ